jgi:CBS-domain-containing membrane protein
MLVRDMMKECVCIGADDTLASAALKLKNNDVGCLPVCEAMQVIGMITDRDVLLRGTASRRSPEMTKVRDVMSAEVVCCTEEDSVERAAELMASHHIHRLPVLNNARELIGVISLSDLSGGASQRAPFEITFYKTLSDSYGHPHHVELARVFIGGGHTKDEAIAAAIRHVEQEKQNPWTAFADGLEVTEIRKTAEGKTVEDVEDRTSERERRIERRAYDLWEQENRPEGRREDHWQQAEQEIGPEPAGKSGPRDT